MRPSHNSFLSIILESVAGPVQSSIAVNHPYADGRVECKKSLSEAAALLVLQRKILFKRIVCPCTVWYCSPPTPKPMVGLSTRET